MTVNVEGAAATGPVRRPGVGTFTLLFFVETFARASVASVIPIQALAILGDKAQVSFLYSAVALGALGFGLVLPLLIRVLRRRRVYTLGALALVAAAGLLLLATPGSQGLGMALRAIGAAALNVTTNLYMLDAIDKRDYVRLDSTRLGWSTIGWTLAPFGGVWLYTHVGPWAAFGSSAAAALVLLGLFWFMRLTDQIALRPGHTPSDNPLRNLARFFGQKRLRLAWTIAFCRSAFWSTFFIYAPILMVVSGAGSEAGGLLVSAGNAMIVTIFWWARLARRWGIRRLTAVAFAGGALALVGCGLTADGSPYLCAALLLLAALLIVPLDATGGVPFYRAVKPRERAAMTSVYRTYIDASDLLPPLAYGVLLGFLPFGAVFIALALLLAVAAWLSLRHVPRGMY